MDAVGCTLLGERHDRFRAGTAFLQREKLVDDFAMIVVDWVRQTQTHHGQAVAHCGLMQEIQLRLGLVNGGSSNLIRREKIFAFQPPGGGPVRARSKA